jgi:phage terminase large subunit-like protein
LGLWFPDGADSGTLLVRFWMPEAGIQEAESRDHVPYTVWAQQGHLTLTPGNVTDYEFVKQEIRRWCEFCRVAEIAYDPWSALQLACELEAEKLPMVKFTQNLSNFSEAVKKAEEMILTGKLHHDGNPVMRWCIMNVALKADAFGNRKPTKQHSTGRIDGVVAALMAIGRFVATPLPTRNPYSKRGLRVL